MICVALAQRVNAEEAQNYPFTVCHQSSNTQIVVDRINRLDDSRAVAKAASQQPVMMPDILDSSLFCRVTKRAQIDRYSNRPQTTMSAVDVLVDPMEPHTSQVLWKQITVAEKRARRAVPVHPMNQQAQPADLAPIGGMLAMMNAFPYGQCTWWANQRYHQLHGIFVPWKTNANAAQWVVRAYQYGWHVSRTPTVGSIIVLQGGVQGAFYLGHVGVVEQLLRNGTVIASSMNWGSHPGTVSSSTFHSGPGVAFIRQ
jgi:surface antigen